MCDGLAPAPFLAGAEKVFPLRSKRLNSNLNLHSRRYDIDSTAVIIALTGATLATATVSALAAVQSLFFRESGEHLPAPACMHR